MSDDSSAIIPIIMMQQAATSNALMASSAYGPVQPQQPTSQVSKTPWKTIAISAFVMSLFSGSLFPFVFVGAIYAGFKAHQQSVNERVERAEASAQRAVNIAMAQQPVIARCPTVSPQEYTNFKNWQQQELARRAASAVQDQTSAKSA